MERCARSQALGEQLPQGPEGLSWTFPSRAQGHLLGQLPRRVSGQGQRNVTRTHALLAKGAYSHLLDLT